MFWQKLKLKHKLSALVGIAALGFILFGVIANLTLDSVRINGDTYNRITAGKQVMAEFASPSQSLIEARLTVYRILQAHSPEEFDQYGKKLQELRADLEKNQAIFRQTLAPGELKTAITDTSYHLCVKYLDSASNELLPAMRSGDLVTAVKILETNSKIFDDQQAAAADIIHKTGQQIQADEQRANELVHSRVAGQALIGLLILAVMTVIGFGIIRSVVRPLNETVQVLDQFSRGDLTVQLAAGGQDEIGTMAASLNSAIGDMRNAFCQIESNVETLASASAEIHAGADQTVRGTENQRAKTTEVVDAMRQMATTVREVAENSAKASGAASQTATIARQGGAIVERATQAMNQIAGSVTLAAEKVDELGQHASKIGSIISVIDEIADQTNLLALNAAIEAARAGEQGRGFAVVADEVRKLAERTTKATREIADMIQTTQSGTAETVQAMRAGKEKVQQGVDDTLSAGRSLEQIIEMTEHLSGMIQSIATAATQQSSATEAVNANISQIAGISAESANAANQSANASRDLSTLATELQQLVTKFRTGSSESQRHPARDRRAFSAPQSESWEYAGPLPPHPAPGRPQLRM